MGRGNECQIAVSVIIPVYNVYEWIDQCMESVVGQTFGDFEVILVDDGSTDGSGEKCREWAQNDSRVRVISKINGGPSSARNCGIQDAKGEFLVFIDPDDWVGHTYLEKLYTAIIENKTNMAECDVYKFNNNTGEQTYHICYGSMGTDYSLEEHMKYGFTAIWKCMIKKSLFTDYGVLFPDCHSEARAVYPLLLALSGKITNVREALYYYRRFRPQALSERPRINNGDEKSVGLLAFDNLLQNFRACGLYDRYEKLLQEIVKRKLSDLLAGLFYRREKEEYLQLAKKYYSYIEEKFPGTFNFPYVTWGGYNLNRILGYMNVLHDPYGRFNFSSIISLMNPVREVKCIHKNKYREIMIRRDIESSFWDIAEGMKPEYIFIDFIEERFDVIEASGGYITKSDAFDGADISLGEHRIIKRGSRECEELWEKSFRGFMERIRENLPFCRVVAVKNLLSTKVGDKDSQRPFEDAEEIAYKNRILHGYYRFLEENFPEIRVVDCTEDSLYFTDKEYEYGAIPSHLNDIENRKIAGRVEEELRHIR